MFIQLSVISFLGLDVEVSFVLLFSSSETAAIFQCLVLLSGQTFELIERRRDFISSRPGSLKNFPGNINAVSKSESDCIKLLLLRDVIMWMVSVRRWVISSSSIQRLYLVFECPLARVLA